MLDTNVVSHFMRFPGGRVANKLRALHTAEVCISVVAVAELRYGIAKVASERLQRQCGFALAAMQIVPFGAPADIAYAALRVALEKAGRPIGPNDMLIAAHALALDVPLITGNDREFSRVPGLVVENWLD